MAPKGFLAKYFKVNSVSEFIGVFVFPALLSFVLGYQTMDPNWSLEPIRPH